MQRWAGKVALVTGASVGIGAEIARALATQGMEVIATARRLENLKRLAADVQLKCKAKIYPIQCDIRKEEEILEVFNWAEKHVGGIDILINNAGVLSSASLLEECTDNFRQIMDVNVIAPAICSRELIQSVKKRQTSGYIINIDSIAGHLAEIIPTSLSIYPASKYAIKGMAASLRNDLAREKLDVKVTNISPGVVRTDMVTDIPAFASGPQLEAKDIMDTVIYVLSLPPRAQVWDIIIMPYNPEQSTWTIT